MSMFSEYLEHFIKQKKINTTDMADYCGVEKSAMYKFVNGSRTPSSEKVVERIAAYLQMTDAESVKLWESYEITQSGYDNYIRRKRVQELISSFYIDAGWVSQAEEKSPAQEFIQTEPVPVTELESKEAVCNAIRRVMLEESRESEGRRHIDVLAQPTDQDLLECIRDLLVTYPDIRVRNLVGIHHDLSISGENRGESMKLLKNTLGLARQNGKYEVRYYYADMTYRQGFPTVLNSVIGSRSAVTFDSEYRRGVLHRDAGVIRMLSGYAEELIRNAKPFLKHAGDFQRIIEDLTFYEDISSDGVYAYVSQPLFSIYMTRAMCERYFIKDLPDRTELIDTFCTSSNKVRDYLLHTPHQYVFGEQGIRRFLNTGRFDGIPQSIMDPLNTDDRFRVLMEFFKNNSASSLKMLKKEWNDSGMPIFLIATGENMYIFSAAKGADSCLGCRVSETGVLKSFRDFLGDLHSYQFYDADSMIAMVTKMIRKR